MKNSDYIQHVKAKCFPMSCSLGSENCPVPDYGFRYGAMKDKTEKYNPHPSHCCARHGCKYGYDDCPVYLQEQKQEYPCESCGYDIAEFRSQEILQNYNDLSAYLVKYLNSKNKLKSCALTKVIYDSLSGKIRVSWNSMSAAHLTVVDCRELDNWIEDNWEINANS